MGNLVTCTRFTTVSIIKVVHAADLRVLELKDPLTAAELMLEFPYHFVVHSSSLQKNQVIFPLSADEELKQSHLYFLLPMQKLHTRLSADELDFMSASFIKASNDGGKSSKLHGESRRVTPLRYSSDAQRQGGDDTETNNVGRMSELFQANSSISALRGSQIGGSEHPMMAKSKSWRPKLQPIGEN